MAELIPLGQQPLGTNNNPLTTNQELVPLGGAPKLNPQLFTTLPGAPDPDEFNFRLTPYIDPYEIRARRQTVGQKWANAAIKAGQLTVATIADNTLGTAVGLVNGLSEMADGDADGAGFMTGFVHNPVSAALYDWTQRTEAANPNYYTRKETHSPWYKNLGTANFWADTIFKNTGFALGAYLSGMGISAGIRGLTSGISKRAQKDVARKIASNLNKTEDEVKALMKAGEVPTEEIIKALGESAKKLKRIDLATQFTSSALGAIGESRIEAIHTYHDMYDRLLRENPGMDAKEAQEMAISAGNMTFAMDFATLSMTNFAQFRNAFGRGYATNKRGVNAIQKAADRKLYEATGGRLSKAANIARIAKNPVIEGFEEEQQFFNVKFSERFMELENDPDARNYVGSFIDASTYALGKSWGDIDSYDNFFAGFITGGLGMPGVRRKDGKLSYQHQGGFYEGVTDYMDRNKNTKVVVEKLNEYMEDPDFQKKLLFLTRDQSLENIKKAALANEDLFNFKNGEDDQFLNMVLAFDAADRIQDLKDLIDDMSNTDPSEYRKLMMMDVDQLPSSVKNELSDTQKTYDAFKDVEDSKIKESLTDRGNTMKEQLEMVLEMRDNLEIKAGNNINRELIPVLLHYGYTVKRSQQRLKELNQSIQESLADDLTVPMQTESTALPKSLYGFVSKNGKKELKILTKEDVALKAEDLTKEEKKELKDKNEELEKTRKGLIKTKREKAETGTTLAGEKRTLFNFSLLETGNEDMFMEAFEEFAKENPFAAEKIKDDVYDAVRLSQRIRTFIDLYSSVYSENKLKDESLRSYEKSKLILELYKYKKAEEEFTVGTQLEYSDPKTNQKKLYEILRYDVNDDGQVVYTLSEYIKGVGRDTSKKKQRKVNIKQLIGSKESPSNYTKVKGGEGKVRKAISQGEVSSATLKQEEVEVPVYTKDGKIKRDKDGKPVTKKVKRKSYDPNTLRGRSEKLLFHLFNLSDDGKIDKAIEILNELVPDNTTTPLSSQLKKIATLFYNEELFMGYLSDLYTDRALSGIKDKLYQVKNLDVRQVLMEKVAERAAFVEKTRNKIIDDYTLAIDNLYGELKNAMVNEDKEIKVFKIALDNFQKGLKELSLEKIVGTDTAKAAKIKLAAAKRAYDKAIKSGNKVAAAKIMATFTAHESKLADARSKVDFIEKQLKLQNKNLEKAKKKLKEVKRKVEILVDAIERMSVFRQNMKDQVEFLNMETTLKQVENLLPEAAYIEQLRKRAYDFNASGLTTQDKQNWLNQDQFKAQEMSEDLSKAKERYEKMLAELEKQEAILMQSSLISMYEKLDPAKKQIVEEEARRLNMLPQQLLTEAMKASSSVQERLSDTFKELIVTFGTRQEVMQRVPLSPEDAQNLKATRKTVEDYKLVYYEELDKEKAAREKREVGKEPSPQQRSVTEEAYKDSGLDYAPTTPGLTSNPGLTNELDRGGKTQKTSIVAQLKDFVEEFMKQRKDSEVPWYLGYIKTGEEEINERRQAEIAEELAKAQPATKEDKDVIRKRINQKYDNEIRDLKKYYAELGVPNFITEIEKLVKRNAEDITYDELKSAFLAMKRYQISTTGKFRELITSVETVYEEPKLKMIVGKDGTKRRETRQEYIDRTANEAYYRRVESLRGMGISIEDVLDIEELRTIKSDVEKIINAREKMINDMSKELELSGEIIADLKKALDTAKIKGEGAVRIQEIIDTIKDFEVEREKIIAKLAINSSGLAKLRSQLTTISELVDRKEIKDFLDIIKTARGVVKDKARKHKKTSSSTSNPNNTTSKDDAAKKKKGKRKKEPATEITHAESMSSPSELELDNTGAGAVAESATSKSALPLYTQVYAKTAGKDQPNDENNPNPSQRRFFRWMEHNRDRVTKGYFTLFIPNEEGFKVSQDDMDGITDPTNTLYMAFTEQDEDGNVVFVNADGTTSKDFDASKALYTSVVDSDLDNVGEYDRYYRPSDNELRKIFGYAPGQGTSKDLEKLFKEDLDTIRQSYKERRAGWFATIRSSDPGSQRPTIKVQFTSRGVAKEDLEMIDPLSLGEFFGDEEVDIFVAESDTISLGGRVLKTSPGHSFAQGRTSKNIVRIRPRKLTNEEIENVVNIFTGYASRHMWKDGKVVPMIDDRSEIYYQGKALDIADLNLFSLLNNITWWQGNNVHRTSGEEINSNDKTRFHFVDGQSVPGGIVQIGEEAFPLVKIGKEGEQSVVSPELIDAIRAHLTDNGYRQINLRLLEDDKPYKHVVKISKDGTATKVEQYDNYKDYILNDKSADGLPVAGVKMQKVDKPTTVEGYESAAPMYMSVYATLRVDLKRSDEIGKARKRKQDQKAAQDQAKANEKKKNKTTKGNKKGFTSNKKQSSTRKPKTPKETKEDNVRTPDNNEDGDRYVKMATRYGQGGGAFQAALQRKAAKGKTAKKDTKNDTKSNQFSTDGEVERRVSDATFTNFENIQEAEKWFKSVFPSSIEFKTTDRLINDRAWGQFLDSAVTIYERAGEGTTYHEAFHVVMKKFLTDREYKALIDEFLRREGVEDLIAEKAKAYSDYSRDAIIEEILADEFMEYQLSGGKMKIPQAKKEGFFKRLLNWLLGFFGANTVSIHETYDRLSRGYYKNAKPAGRAKAGVGVERRFSTVESPLLKEFISVMDRRFFALANNKYRDEFNSYLSGDTTKAPVFEKILNDIESDLKDKRDRAIELANDPKASMDEIVTYDRIKNNLNSFLNKWDRDLSFDSDVEQLKNSFKEFYRNEYLSRYSLFQELELEEIKDDGSKDSGSNTWAYNSMTRSAMNSSSQRLRLFFAGIPQTYKGIKPSTPKGDMMVRSDEFANMPIATPFGKAFALYSKELANTRTLEEAYHRILQNFDTLPGSAFVLSELKLSEFVSGDIQSLTHDDLSLLTDFAQAFNLQSMNYAIGAVGKAGTATIMNATEDSQATRIKTSFLNTEKLLAAETGLYAALDKETNSIKYTGIRPIEGGLSTDPFVRDMQIRDVYAAIGMTFSDEVWHALPDSQDAAIKNSDHVSRILKLMGRKGFSVYDRRAKQGKMLNKIVQELVKYDTNAVENSHININGDRVYDNILHNYHSAIMVAINKVGSLQELYEQYPHLDSQFTANSLVLKPGGLLFSDSKDDKGNLVGKKKENAEISLFMGEGARTDDGSVRKEFSKMTPTEKFKFVLDMSLDNKFMMIRAADNSNERFFSFNNQTLFAKAEEFKFIETLLSYLEDEMAYVGEVRELSNNYKFKVNFETAEDVIKTSPIIRMMSSDPGVKESLVKILDTHSDAESIRRATNNLAQDLLEDLDVLEDIVNGKLKGITDSLIERATKLGLVKWTGGNYINKGVPFRGSEGKVLEKSQISEEALFTQMDLIARNFMLAQIEQMKLFSGHPAQYVKYMKELDDFSVDNMVKRMSGIVGPKRSTVVDINWWKAAEELFRPLGGLRRLFTDSEGRVSPTIINNPTLNPKNIKPVLRAMAFGDVIMQDENLAKLFVAYDENNEADAQGIIHLDAYRDLLNSNGMWNLALEKLYQWEMNNEMPVVFDWNGEQVAVTEEKDLLTPEGKMPVFNPLKPQYFGAVVEKANITSMFKLSVYPAIPSVVGKRVLGKMQKFMSLNDIGIITFDSGNKVGARTDENGELPVMFNEKGDFNYNSEKKTEGLPVQHIYYEFFGIQVSTGNTKKSSTSFGTQSHKQIMYEMLDGGVPRPMSFDMPGMEEASEKNTNRVLNQYNSFVNARQEMGVESLRRKLGLVKNVNGDYVVNDIDKTIKFLKDIVRDRDLPHEYVEAFEQLKEDKGLTPMGLAVLPARVEIERILYSIADKESIKKNMKGAGLIQAAGTGWEEIAATRNYKNGKFDSSNLKMYTKEEAYTGELSITKRYNPQRDIYVDEVMDEDGDMVPSYVKSIVDGRREVAIANSEEDAIEVEIKQAKENGINYFSFPFVEGGTEYVFYTDKGETQARLIKALFENKYADFSSQTAYEATLGYLLQYELAEIKKFTGDSSFGEKEILAFIEENLAPKMTKTVVTRMQVYVGHYFKEILGDIKDNVIVDPRLLEMLGFRIPTSGLNSIDAIEVVGFLPPKVGDIIVMPSQIVTKAGSDYDVDKLTVYYPHYTTVRDKEGNVTQLKYLEFYSEEEIENNEKLRGVLLDRVRGQIVNDNLELREMMIEIQERHNKDYINELKDEKRSVMSDFMNRKSVEEFIKEFDLDPNKTSSASRLKKAVNGMERTFTLLMRAQDELSGKDGDALLSLTELVRSNSGKAKGVDSQFLTLLAAEDPLLFLRNFSGETMTVEQVSGKIDGLLTTVNKIRKALDKRSTKAMYTEAKKIQERIDALSEAMKKEINRKVYKEVEKEFNKMDIYHKNGQKAVENAMTSLMQKIVLSPENYENLMEPIGSSILESIAKEITGLMGVEERLDSVEDLLNLDHALNVTERYLQGKPGVGIGSLSSVNTIIAEKAKWFIQELNELQYYNPTTKQYEKFNPSLILENSAEIGEAPRLYGNNTKAINENERSKLRLLNNFINAYVDIANDPFIIDLNAGIDIAPTIIYLIRAGVAPRTAFYMVNQPIIRDYMDALRSTDNNIVTEANIDSTDKRRTKQQIADDVYSLYSNDKLLPSDVTRFGDVRLKEMLDPKNQKGDNYKEDQLRLLDEFLKARVVAGELSNAVRAINYDTAGHGGSTAHNVVADMGMKQVRANGAIGGFMNVFKPNNYLRSYRKSIQDNLKIMGNFFPELNGAHATNIMLEQFEEYFKFARGIRFDDKVNAMDIMLVDMILHMSLQFDTVDETGKSISRISDRVDELLYSSKNKDGEIVRPSVARALQDLEFEGILDKRSNSLLSRLNYVFDEVTGDRVVMYDQPKEKEDIDDTIMAWREMFESNDDRVRRVARQLMELSLLQSGFRGHPVGLTKSVPPERMASHIKASYKAYNSLGPATDISDSVMMPNIIMANANNRILLPKSGRVPLTIKYDFKPEYSVPKGTSLTLKNKIKAERQTAIDAGIDVWEPRIVVNTWMDKKPGMEFRMPVIINGTKKTMDLTRFFNLYKRFTGKRIGNVESSNRNNDLFKGSFFVAQHNNPIVKGKTLVDEKGVDPDSTKQSQVNQERKQRDQNEDC